MSRVSTKSATALALAVGLAAFSTSAANAQKAAEKPTNKITIDGERSLCGTWENWLVNNPEQAEGGVAGACPLQGNCDDPVVRNAYIPSGSSPIDTIRIRIHAFANNDGSNPASTLAEIAQQVAKLNADFAPWRIQFTHTAEIINDSTYRDFSPGAEDAGMKNLYADTPGTQLNVYVTHVNCCYAGLGTFPWDPNSLGNLGGIIIDDGYFDATNEVLTHEVGHCIGLWHTHHGVSEVPACSGCYEPATLGSDTNGDYCGDTPPTPIESFGDCDGTGGNDSCNGSPWTTQASNYMGYAGPACWTQFTPQQAGRMHCWIQAKLTGWVVAAVDPCGSAGSCFAAHASKGCDNVACCDAVCGLDPFCCDNGWDEICVNEATDLCTGCGGAGVGSCFVAHATPNCDNEICCTAVCAADPFCCNNQWDGACVTGANTLCKTCGGSGTPTCYAPHGTPFCNDAACCNSVCDLDAYCCNNEWDNLCVHEALDNCVPAIIAGPLTNPANGNQYFLIDLASWPNASDRAASLGGHLVTVNNAAENEWVRVNLANNGGVARTIWLGFNDVAAEGTFVWTGGVPTAYTNWGGGEPNNYFEEDYTEFSPTNGVWNDIERYGGQDNFGVVEVEIAICGDAKAGNCWSTHGPFCNDAACCNTVCAIDAFCCTTNWDIVCRDEAFDLCTPPIVTGPVVNPITKNVFYKTGVTTWIRGEALAVSLGGHLVTVNNAQENAYVVSLLAGAEGWIGYSDAATEGAFKWSSNQFESYTNWFAGEPNNGANEDYAEISPGGTWNDIAKYGTYNDCAVIEIEAPGGCGDAASGSCYAVHAPFCNDLDCCSLVCAGDPFCCGTSWDSLCVNAALSQCGPDCPEDLNNDNKVDAADLAIMLGAWGAAGGPPDINGSGLVDAADLALLLGGWGPC